VNAWTRRDGHVPNKGKTHFLSRRISTSSVLWGLLCSRGRGARNNVFDDSFDYSYRSEMNACLRAARRSHSARMSRKPSSRDSPISDDFRARWPSHERRDSRFLDTHAADRSTDGVDWLLEALDDKRIAVSLQATTKAQAAHTFKATDARRQRRQSRHTCPTTGQESQGQGT
jgi:hypothetical protein